MGIRLIAIIQARIGSTRLPGKVMAPILEKPMLHHIVDRLGFVEAIEKIVVATSESEQDDGLAAYCKDKSIPCFRGSEIDVLDRFHRAAVAFGGDPVMRITGDCPLVDPGVVNRLVDLYRCSRFDYCAVACGAGAAESPGAGRYPDGLDAEIFSLATLATACQEATLDMHREHVTPFIWQQPQRFRIGMLCPENGDFSDCRWTVDRPEDLELVHWIYKALYPANARFGMREILELIKRHPEKAAGNRKLLGKEGYENFWS